MRIIVTVLFVASLFACKSNQDYVERISEPAPDMSSPVTEQPAPSPQNDEEKTERSLKKWLLDVVGSFAGKHGYIPRSTDEIGSVPLKDAWGRETKYFRDSPTQFSVWSAGVDGQWDTDDDLGARGTIPIDSLKLSNDPIWSPEKFGAICALLRHASVEPGGVPENLRALIPSSEIKHFDKDCLTPVLSDLISRARKAENDLDLGLSADYWSAIANATGNKKYRQEAARLDLEYADSQGSIKLRGYLASTIFSDYRFNELAAKKKYGGQQFYVYGKVESVGEDITGTPYITFKAGYWSHVQCMFKDSDAVRQRLEKVKKGKEGGLVCQDAGFFITPILRDCKFSKAIKQNEELEVLVKVYDF